MSKNIILIIGASSDVGIDLIRSITEDALIIAHYNNSSHQILELSNTTMGLTYRLLAEVRFNVI